VLIKKIHEEGRETYGWPRIRKALAERGHRVGGNRIRRIMRQEGIYGRRLKRWNGRRSDRDVTPPAANLLERDFQTSRPNLVWCGDITEFQIDGVKLYVAVVIDLFARRVVGLRFGPRQTSALVIGALFDALNRRRPDHGVIFHTDRGVQYRSKLFRATAFANGVVQSMSRAYTSVDNAVAESFFATLEHELASRKTWNSVAQAEHDIRDFVFNFYNPIRMHSHNGYMSPEGLEAKAA
jgi:putative transposase